MALETIPNHSDVFNMMLYETLYSSHYGCYSGSVENAFTVEQGQNLRGGGSPRPLMLPLGQFSAQFTADRRADVGLEGRNKRRRSKVCKSEEEAETQRMTHIAVERNRRKQMNEHLAVLRSLMPESYAQRGDQASIVGGAIDYVKELEHLAHSLEAQRLQILQQTKAMRSGPGDYSSSAGIFNSKIPANPLMEFFSDPPFPASQVGNIYSLKNNAGLGDIEVVLIESHANLRILSKNHPRQLIKLVSGFQALHLSILHLNVTSLDPLVLYSISAKVDEGSQLTTPDSIADAVLHILRLVQEDAASPTPSLKTLATLPLKLV